jgi:hypothetical protein
MAAYNPAFGRCFDPPQHNFIGWGPNISLLYTDHKLVEEFPDSVNTEL